MKGYGWLILTVAVLLMLIPLPAFSAASPKKTPSTADPVDVPTVVKPLTPPENTEDGEVFRVLCGEEVITLTEADFLYRILAMEMSPDNHEEALKAQVVATYT